MLNIEAKHLQIVKEILAKHNYNFYVFGSRITEKAKRLSDLDLFYTENIPINAIMQLEEEFEGSDLPYKVDLVDWSTLDDAIRNFKQSCAIILCHCKL